MRYWYMYDTNCAPYTTIIQQVIDIAVKEENDKLLVKCSHHGCQRRGEFKDFLVSDCFVMGIALIL